MTSKGDTHFPEPMAATLKMIGWSFHVDVCHVKKECT